MFNIGNTFIFSVLTLYTFYRYILQQNELYRDLSYSHFHWQIFYFFYAFILIYAGSTVTSKVIYYFIQIYLKLSRFLYSFSLKIFRQGKKTAKLLHDMINECNDTEITLSVRLHSVLFIITNC